jgi:hypothetical protein
VRLVEKDKYDPKQIAAPQMPRSAPIPSGPAGGWGTAPRLPAAVPCAREPSWGRARFTRTGCPRSPARLAGALQSASERFCARELLVRAWSSHAQKRRPGRRETPARCGGAPRFPVRVNDARAPGRPRARDRHNRQRGEPQGRADATCVGRRPWGCDRPCRTHYAWVILV